MKNICESLGHFGKPKRVKYKDYDSFGCKCSGEWHSYDIEILGSKNCPKCNQPLTPKIRTMKVIDCPMCKKRIQM